MIAYCVNNFMLNDHSFASFVKYDADLKYFAKKKNVIKSKEWAEYLLFEIV